MAEDVYSFGDWVRLRRQSMVLSREDLARRVGVAEVSIRKIEADERRPSPQVAALLAQQLQLAAETHSVFVQVARGLLAVNQLPPPIPGSTRASSATPATAAPALLPSGTVTFLFTDIEGSTRLWEQHPQAMQQALARHDALLHASITAHGGAVVKSTGDGMHAVFARATDAVHGALAAQRTLQAERWGEPGPLRVRMALHTGVAEQRAGDYFGPPLNRVARLLAAGHGGQILLSLAAEQLVRDQLPEGVTLRDVGTHRLKDLSYPEQIFQLLAPNLPSDFPPLNTLNARRTNLPAQPTALIGREQDVATVCALLRRSEVRLVTLTGPGGTGKTRLGLQVAAELLDEFTHGVYFVNLAPISDPSLVASVIAQILGIAQAGDQSLHERLQFYLRDKRLLLLLDNVEQIVDAAPFVAELLAGCPLITVLVTSRVPLHLRGEKEIAVSPLALPPADDRRATSDDRKGDMGSDRSAVVTQYAAVQLFIQRALDVQPNFAVTNDNAPAVAEICARLDGLPLAIELAAARLKLFAPEALLARLSNRLALLTGGARDLPARQQTLRSAIAWSYDLLDNTVQTLFARLGVFVGGWTLEAATAVCSAHADKASDMLDQLELLVDSSLLVHVDGVNGEPRFVMLETIREYALEWLAASGEMEAMQRRHAAYYLRLAQAAEVGRVDNMKVVAAQLDQEYANMLAALTWSQTADNAGLGVHLVDALGWFWNMRGEWWQLREWLRDILLRQPAVDTPTIRALRLELAAGTMDEPDQAQPLLEESLALYQAVGDNAGSSSVLCALGALAHQAGDLPRSLQLFEAGLALARSPDDKRHLSSLLHQVGNQMREDGDYPRAAALFAECLTLRRELGDTSGIANVFNAIGDLAVAQGDLVQAWALYQEACGVFRAIEHRNLLAWTLRNLGRVAHLQGDDAQARPLLEESLSLFQQHGWKYAIGCCLDALAGVTGTQGQPERAVRLFGAGHAQRQVSRDNLAWAWPVGARVDYEQDVATVRAQLDPTTFDAAWAAGAALTLDEAIAEALAPSGAQSGE